MAVQAPKKPIQKNKNKPVSAPAVQKRELTRAEKVAASREAAARRNAALVSSPAPKAPPTAKPGTKKPAPKRVAAKRPQKAQAKLTPRKAVVSRETKKEHQANARREINRKMSTQTRAHRHEEKTQKKVSGSVKNLEIKRRSSEGNHSFRVKRKQTAFGKLLLVRLVLFLVVFTIMFSLTAGLFAMSLKPGKGFKGKSYTLQLGADIPKDAEKLASNVVDPTYLEIPSSCATRYGELYIPISALSDMCSLSVTGSTEELRYLPRESDDQSVKFVVGSDIAYVNGSKVRMISPSFLYESRLYIPLDFMQKYSMGLDISIDEGNRKITVHKIQEGYDAQTDENIYSTLEFNLHTTTALEQVEDSYE
ncbi:MAG: copper amine oxidase N-terminal domain-containing protein [Clostridia bacterium]|nr:copper amine oxidase N-terminal domain-containing protein [Clostridia bacterium]